MESAFTAPTETDNFALVERSTYEPFLSCSNSAVGTISSVYPQSKQTKIFWTT
jgi:hypothetical protein